ncbi:MAG: leucyl aminopeptidase [Methylovirgula sp.]|jgi:leucyl aminopeptidase
MWQPIKVEFVPLASVAADSPPHPGSKRGDKSKPAQTLVIFMGPDFALGAATRKLIGSEGEALIKRAAGATKFRGKELSALDIVAPSGFVADRLLVIGTGGEEAKAKSGKDDADKDESPAAHAKDAVVKPADYIGLGGYTLGKLGAGALALVVFDPPRAPKNPADAAAEFVEGMRLRDYKFDSYKTKKKDEDESAAAEVLVAVEDPAAAKREAKAHDAEAEGVAIARTLVNEPANVLYPEEFARRAQELEELGVEVKVLDEDEMGELGMGALLGVGQGSDRESRMVIMRWRGTKKDESKEGKEGKEHGKSRPIAFIGKGVTFDTGGISIKPAAGMEDMKGDMAGAACVIGLMHTLAARKAKVDVVGAIGLVENMPGANAQRPGDIVKSMSGQTIEVINTDAEGRLVLADLLWYVQDKYKPQFMIDLATLTGAIVVALGQEHAGLFSNDDELSERLLTAGKETNEKVWRLPLGPAYDKLIDSKFADMKNTGGRHGGSITAAQFLQRFVNGTPWAHLDIAGTGMNSPASDTNQSWGSGYGVRLLDRLVRKYYEA